MSGWWVTEHGHQMQARDYQAAAATMLTRMRSHSGIVVKWMKFYWHGNITKNPTSHTILGLMRENGTIMHMEFRGDPTQMYAPLSSGYWKILISTWVAGKVE